MLFMVLLMIHNVHQYLEFFKMIRESIKEGTLDDCKKRIKLKFKQDNGIQVDRDTSTIKSAN